MTKAQTKPVIGKHACEHANHLAKEPGTQPLAVNIVASQSVVQDGNRTYLWRFTAGGSLWWLILSTPETKFTGFEV